MLILLLLLVVVVVVPFESANWIHCWDQTRTIHGEGGSSWKVGALLDFKMATQQ